MSSPPATQWQVFRVLAVPTMGMLVVATFSLLVVGTGCRRRPPITAPSSVAPTPRAAVTSLSSRPMAVVEPETGFWDVSAMGWAADGAQLAVAEGSVVHVLEATGYREVLRIQTSTIRIAALAFSPDGKSLATSGTGRPAAVVWDLATALEQGRMMTARDDAAEGEGRGLETLDFSPDGKLLSGWAWDRPQADIWTAATVATAQAATGATSPPIAQATPTRTLQLFWRQRFLQGPRATAGDPPAHPQMLAFRPDGAGAVGVTDEALVTWDLNAPATDARTDVSQMLQPPHRRRHGHGGDAADSNDPLHAVAVHPQGKVVAAATESGAIVFWALPGGKFVHALATAMANPLLAFSRDGGRLTVVAGMDGSARTFKATGPGGGWTPGASFGPFAPRADAVALDRDGGRIAVAAAGALAIRNIQSGQLTQVMRPPLALTAVAVDRQTSRLAVGTAAGEIGVLTVETGALSWLVGHTGPIKALAFSEDGRWLVSGGSDRARIWDVLAVRSAGILPQEKPVNAVAVSPDARSVATAGDDGLLRIWEASSGKPVAALPGNGCPLLTIRFSPRGPLLAANSTDGTLLTWDARTLAPRFTSDQRPICSGERSGWPNTLAFTGDGKSIGYAGPQGRLKWWNGDTTNGTTLGTTADGLPARAVAISPRDSLLVAATADSLRAWSPPDPRSRIVLPTSGHHAVIAAAFADGRFLFTLDGRGLLAIREVNFTAPSAWAAAHEPAALPEPLVLRLTVALFDHESGYVKSASAGPMIQWLGSRRPPARCLVRAHLQSAEVCAERSTSQDLLRATLSP